MCVTFATLSRRGRARRNILGTAVCLLAVSLAATACTTPGAGEDTPIAPETGVTPAYLAPDQSGGSGGTATAATVPDPDAEIRAAVLAATAGVGSVTVIEDWSAFASADEVEDAITRNLGIGANTMDLSVAPSSGAMPEGDALVMAYDVQEVAPDDFVGFNRDLNGPADWSGATHIALWVAPEGDPDVNVVFQFRESGGEVWRYEGPVPAATDAGPLLLPLDTDTFRWADWSTTQNGTIDLAAVDQYGLYVGHAGPGRTGTVIFGPVVHTP